MFASKGRDWPSEALNSARSKGRFVTLEYPEKNALAYSSPLSATKKEVL